MNMGCYLISMILCSTVIMPSVRTIILLADWKLSTAMLTMAFQFSPVLRLK